MRPISIFLASSYEMKEEREQFTNFINRKNKTWTESHHIFLRLELWEDFLDAMSPTRLQDEYNKVIESCDIFVLLAWNTVGIHVMEEFEKAFGQFQETAKPFIYTYFKTPHSTQDRNELQSLWAFEDKLLSLGHYKTRFKGPDDLNLHFSEQLDKLYAADFKRLDKAPDTSQTTTVTQITNSKNVITGNITSNGGGITVGDNNTNTYHHHSGSGDIIGRDKVINYNGGNVRDDKNK